MKRHLVVAAAAAALASASVAGAQVAKPTTVELTPYVGYMVFGTYLNGPIGTSISNTNSALYGAQLGVPLSSTISVIGNFGYAKSDMKVGIPFFNGFSIGSSDVFLYDGGLQLRLPMQTQTIISPFVQGGVGAVHYNVENSLLQSKSTNLAYNVGGGLDFNLTPNFGVRAMVKDYIGKFDFKEAAQVDVASDWSHNVALTFGIKMSF
jgi:opacity protein-like surface antigen